MMKIEKPPVGGVQNPIEGLLLSSSLVFSLKLFDVNEGITSSCWLQMRE